jgi:hypothetical protein
MTAVKFSIALGLAAGWITFSGLMALQVPFWGSMCFASIIAVLAFLHLLPDEIYKQADADEERQKSRETRT